MIPDLISGAAAPAAAWPAAAAGAPDPAAHTDAAQSDPFADLFADLLAATMAPQAGSDSAGSIVTGRPVALPVSLPDLWLGLAMAAPSGDTGIPEDGAEELGAVTGDLDDDEALEASSAVPVPVTDAADAGVPVPIIVQVPTDIMSAAPVDARHDEAPLQASEPVAAAVMPGQDKAAGREAAPAAPVLQPQSVAGVNPRQTASADPKNPADGTKPGAPESGSPSGIERTLTPMERMESIGADAPAPDAKTPAGQESQSVGRGVTRRQMDPAGGEGPPYDRAVAATPANVTAKPAAIDVPASNGPAVTPVSAVTGMPEGDAAVAEGSEVLRTAGREGAPSGPATTASQPKAQAPREHPSQAPVAPVTTPAPLEQAAQAVAGIALGQDAPAGREGQPHLTERSAATAAVQGIPSAVSSQQGGDASQNGGGNQPSQDQAARDIAPAARPADVLVSSTPLAVTTAEPASRPVQQAAAPLPAFTPAEETENLGRLVESMRVQWRQGVPEATVRLNPEHLGEVTISIRVDKGVVSASFHAETPAVQQWLEAQEDKLRNGLADQGLNLEKFVVQRDRQQQERREQRPHQQARYRQPEEPGQRFEVTV